MAKCSVCVVPSTREVAALHPIETPPAERLVCVLRRWVRSFSRNEGFAMLGDGGEVGMLQWVGFEVEEVFAVHQPSI
jgi:hypothetical protein